MVAVIKLGGSVLRTGFPEPFIVDLKSFLEKDRAVFVHGGAAIVTGIAEKMGKKQEFVVSPDGMKSRYTDKETMEIYTMVMSGKINKYLVAALISHGIRSIGLCGADGFFLKAERKKRLLIVDERGRKVMIDGGYTGKITSVDTKFLTSLLDLGLVPVISPIAIDDEFQLLNVDSDRTAAYIAGALKADSLMFFTDVEGLMLEDKVVRKLSLDEAKAQLPKIGHGMRKKVYAGLEALDMGAHEVIISSGTRDAPISTALRHEAGTFIGTD